MPDLPTHRQFFGDQEYDFALPPELITELERKTGRGIGGLCRAMFAGDFQMNEITETIRLGLIGGGVSPEDAKGLVAAYVAPRPLVETFGLSVAILEMLFFGQAQNGVKTKRTRKK